MGFAKNGRGQSLGFVPYPIPERSVREAEQKIRDEQANRQTNQQPTPQQESNK